MTVSNITKIRKRKGLKAYTHREYEALLSILKYRCLSEDQIFRLHYDKKQGSEPFGYDYFIKKFRYFRQDKVVELVYQQNDIVPDLYGLTGFGLRLVKKYFPDLFEQPKLANNLFNWDIDTRRLTINPTFIPHQYYLNCFAIEFLDLFADVPNIQYIDERHMAISQSIRPDGLCIIPKRTVQIGNVKKEIPETHLFFECDMGTEPPNVITKKFTAYRRFLSSTDLDPNARRIILFICRDPLLPFANGLPENPGAESKSARKRIVRIKKSISDSVLDLVNDDLEILVATHFKLLSTLKLLYLPEYLGVDKKDLLPDVENILHTYHPSLEIKDLDKLSRKYLNGLHYTCYAKEPKSQRLLLFLESFGDPMSAMHKIQWHQRISSLFLQATGRQMDLVIVANKEESISDMDEVCGFSTALYDNVYCTTVSRLQSLPLNEAIYKITHYGTAHFDSNMRNLIPNPQP